jgi:hypothetical protein
MEGKRVIGRMVGGEEVLSGWLQGRAGVILGDRVDIS